MLLSGALAATYFPSNTVGLVILVGGGGILAAVLWQIGRGVQRSRYRRERWQRQDTFLTVVSLLVLFILISTSFLAPDLLNFYPYPRLTLPPFHPLVAAALPFWRHPSYPHF